MADDPAVPRILTFPRVTRGKLITLQPPDASTKVGLWPLAGGDVVMSLDLLQIVLTALEHGTAEERVALSRQLQAAFQAPYI